MSEIHHFPSLLLSDFFLFCFFILSHPLYFSYLIFFSPYLLKLFSFLSPLFVTTFLLLLALLTISPNLVLDKSATELSETEAGLVLGVYRAVVEKLRAKVGHGGEEFHQYVELEAYKIVFEASSPDLGENPVEVLEIEAKEQPLASSNDDHVAVEKEEKEKELLKPVSVDSNKVEGERIRQASMRSGSNGIGYSKSETKESGHHHYGTSGDQNSTPRSDAYERANDLWSSPDNGNWDYYSSMRDQYSPSLGSFGSMRRENEWRRTLACKLFEERHNADGGEDNMDMLWEAYEANSDKSNGNVICEAKKKGKSRFGSSSSEFSTYDHCSVDEDEEVQNVKLCCLEALKFSAGKMNLGMRRPNLVKFSKALKGIGWLHKVSIHSKKAQRF